MTLTKFLEHLSKSDGWATDIGRIRKQQDNDDFCPITYVAYAVSGIYYKKNAYQDAALNIGLDDWLAGTIVEASDTALTFYPKLRTEIRKACKV